MTLTRYGRKKNAYSVSQRKENMGEIEYLAACYKEAEPSRHVRKKDPRRAWPSGLWWPEDNRCLGRS